MMTSPHQVWYCIMLHLALIQRVCVCLVLLIHLWEQNRSVENLKISTETLWVLPQLQHPALKLRITHRHTITAIASFQPCVWTVCSLNQWSVEMTQKKHWSLSGRESHGHGVPKIDAHGLNSDCQADVWLARRIPVIWSMPAFPPSPMFAPLKPLKSSNYILHQFMFDILLIDIT